MTWGQCCWKHQVGWRMTRLGLGTLVWCWHWQHCTCRYIRYRNDNRDTLLPWAILGSLPRPGIRIKVLQVGDILLLALGAGTRHGGAEEQVDDQHDNKEDTKGDAEIEKPNWTPATILTWSWFLHWNWPRLDHKDRVGGHQSSVIFFWILNSGICFGL